MMMPWKISNWENGGVCNAGVQSGTCSSPYHTHPVCVRISLPVFSYFVYFAPIVFRGIVSMLIPVKYEGGGGAGLRRENYTSRHHSHHPYQSHHHHHQCHHHHHQSHYCHYHNYLLFLDALAPLGPILEIY